MSATAYDWEHKSSAERNAACAQYLPTNHINPIRSWHFFVGTSDQGALCVNSEAEAAEWLAEVTKNKTTWEKITKFPDSVRGEAAIKEQIRYVRYSDTPSGAWMLAEYLIDAGWRIQLDCNVNTFIRMSRGDVVKSVCTNKTMPELMAILFLMVHGEHVLFNT